MSNRVLTLFDQGVCSGSNVLVLVFAARVLSAEQFGYFALTLSIYTISCGLTQSALGDYGGLAAVRGNVAFVKWAASHVLLLSAPVTAATLIISVAVLHSHDAFTFLALGAALPMLLLQDFYRLVGIACDRVVAVLASDLIWLAAEIFLFLGLTRFSIASSSSLITAWALSGVLAFALLILLLPQYRPTLKYDARTLRKQWPSSSRTGLEFLLLAGAGQVILFAAAGGLSVAAAGALRLAQSLFGPLNVIFSASRLILLPELGRGPLHRTPFVRHIQWTVVLAAIAWGVALIAVATFASRTLLGDSWERAIPLVPAFAVQYVALAAAAVPLIRLRAVGDAAGTLLSRGSAALVTLLGGLIGVGSGSVQIIVWSSAASAITLAGISIAARRREAIRNGRLLTF